MQPIYSIEVSLLSNTIPKHIDAFAPSWHKFKYSVKIQIKGLALKIIREQPFPFPRYVEFGDLPNAAAAAATKHYPTRQSQDNPRHKTRH
jgi:hypothetical protein